MCQELIDTLWNVNLKNSAEKLKQDGINRYIMECKSDIYKKNARRDNELIDTLWNVNTRLTYCSINYLSAN